MTDHSAFKNNFTPDELPKISSTRGGIIDGRNVLPINKGGKTEGKVLRKYVEGFQVFIKASG